MATEQYSDDFGYLALFDPDGNQVQASQEDLLSIEAMSFDKELHRRVVGDRSGRYWLISDRPGMHAMLLEVSIFHCYPREGDEWSVSYVTNGIASHPHWEFDSATLHFKEERWGVEPDDRAPIPENVLAIAREHVTYRLGRTPGPDPLDLHGVRMRDAVEMRQRLVEFLEGTIEPTDLIRQIAGKRVAIFELVLAVTFFCNEHSLDGREIELLVLMVCDDQHERLATLLDMLNDQLGSE